eukprot:g3451.t1
MTPNNMSFLPLSNEEIELAKTKSKEIQDKLAKYRFWTGGANVGGFNHHGAAKRMPMPTPTMGGQGKSQKLLALTIKLEIQVLRSRCRRCLACAHRRGFRPLTVVEDTTIPGTTDHHSARRRLQVQEGFVH